MSDKLAKAEELTVQAKQTSESWLTSVQYHTGDVPEVAFIMALSRTALLVI